MLRDLNLSGVNHGCMACCVMCVDIQSIAKTPSFARKPSHSHVLVAFEMKQRHHNRESWFPLELGVDEQFDFRISSVGDVTWLRDSLVPDDLTLYVLPIPAVQFEGTESPY